MYAAASSNLGAGSDFKSSSMISNVLNK